MFWSILLIISLVAINGFFVAAEFALVKTRLNDIEALAREGSTAARLTKSVLKRLDSYLSACQLGITLASLGLGWIGEPHVADMLEPVVSKLGFSEDAVHYIAFPIAFMIITFLHITAGEQVPKMLAIQKFLPTALVVSPPLVVFYKAFRPFIWFLNTSSNFMLRMIGIGLVTEHGESPTETELRLTLLHAAAGGHVTRRERLIMENVLDLEEKLARRYMLPRHQVVYLNRQDTIEEKLRIASQSGHTRFPLCDGDLEHIIGIVHVKDIFNAMLKPEALTALVDMAREPLYLPETIKLDILLLEFQRRQAVLAILLDEYGVVSGMITIENVIEELVGPIQDEFDSELPLLIKKGANRFELEASCPVDLAVKGCQLELPADITADTIGGVMIEILGHIPQEGEQATVGRHTLTVLAAEPTRIDRMLIEPMAGNPDEADVDTDEAGD